MIFLTVFLDPGLAGQPTRPLPYLLTFCFSIVSSEPRAWPQSHDSRVGKQVPLVSFLIPTASRRTSTIRSRRPFTSAVVWVLGTRRTWRFKQRPQSHAPAECARCPDLTTLARAGTRTARQLRHHDPRRLIDSLVPTASRRMLRPWPKGSRRRSRLQARLASRAPGPNPTTLTWANTCRSSTF